MHDVIEQARVTLAARLPSGQVFARLGLGAMLVFAGVHKLLVPIAWAVYVTDWLAPLLVVSPRVFMLANGPPEILVGLLLLADRYTAASAAIAAVSLLATSLYLAVVSLTTGLFVDTLVRDVGLTGLALAVLSDAVKTGGGRGG